MEKLITSKELKEISNYLSIAKLSELAGIKKSQLYWIMQGNEPKIDISKELYRKIYDCLQANYPLLLPILENPD